MALSIFSSLPAGQVGEPYWGVVQGQGVPGPFQYWVIAVGATGWPDGLTYDLFIGIITGRPTKAGTYTFTLKCTTLTEQVIEQFTIVIAPGAPPAQLSLAVDTPTGTVGTSYVGGALASGGAGNYTYFASDLPTGLSIDPNTGAVVGTPTAAGSFNSTIGVTDKNSVTVQQTVSILIQPRPDVPPPPDGGGVVGVPGLTVNNSGQITGTPTRAGTFTTTLRVMDSAGMFKDIICSITVTES